MLHRFRRYGHLPVADFHRAVPRVFVDHTLQLEFLVSKPLRRFVGAAARPALKETDGDVDDEGDDDKRPADDEDDDKTEDRKGDVPCAAAHLLCVAELGVDRPVGRSNEAFGAGGDGPAGDFDQEGLKFGQGDVEPGCSFGLPMRVWERGREAFPDGVIRLEGYLAGDALNGRG